MVDAVGGVEVADEAAEEEREEETEEETEGDGSGSEAEDDDAPVAGVLLVVVVLVLEPTVAVWGDGSGSGGVGEDAVVEAPDGGALTDVLESPPIMPPESRCVSRGLFMRPPGCERR